MMEQTPAGHDRRHSGNAGSQDGLLSREVDPNNKAGQEKIESMMESCLEKTEATHLEGNPEEIVLSQSLRKSVRKRRRWKVSEHWRSNMGTGI
jgi:hypothetical protein